MRRAFVINILAVLLMLCVYKPIFSQEEGECKKDFAKKSIKKFEKAIETKKDGKTDEAITQLKSILEEESDYADVYYLLGELYYRKAKLALENARASRNNIKPIITEAENYFIKATELCPTLNCYAYYCLAEIYMGRDDYKNTIKYSGLFFKNSQYFPKNFKARVDSAYGKMEKMERWAKFYDKLLSNPVDFKPRCVEGINSQYDDYKPFISADEEVAIFTRRMPPAKDNSVSAGYQVNKEIFTIAEKKNGVWDGGHALPAPFNKTFYNGSGSMTLDNLHIYYTVCEYVDGGKYLNCDIVRTDFVDGYWTDPVNLGPSINKPDGWDSNPSISSDGRTLYYVTDREEKTKGYEIYKSVRDESGQWVPSQNAGGKINSTGNENTPFMHSDSQTLYFSSKGGLTLGGYDVFFCKMDDNGEWAERKNLGYPINTKEDEVGFVVAISGEKAYYSTDKINCAGKLDIVSFDLPQDVRPEKVMFIKGTLKDEKSNNPVQATLELKNVDTKAVTKIDVDSSTGKYAMAVKVKNDYILTVKKDDYAFTSKYISKKDSVTDKPVKIDLITKPIEVGETYKINDIHYATNSAELAIESKVVLDGFIEFLNNHPKLSVIIHGHTDNVGKDNENMILSENRAKSVYSYLTQNGIDTARLKSKGFGQTKPVVSNSTEEGRAKNRRTEFVIISK